MKLAVEEIKKIVLFRALQLGDLLCTIPAVRVLRDAYPAAEITLAGLPWAKSLVERFPEYFDRFIHFPGYPGLPEQPLNPAAFTHFLGTVQQMQPDLALQMQGNGTIVNPMVELFGARHTAGFCVPHDYCPNRDLFLEYPNHGSEIERHIALMNFLGLPSAGTYLEFPLTDKDRDDFRKLALGVEEKGYVCIHPGSRGDWRQWPTEHFATLGDYCAEQGFKVIITGTSEERPITDKVQQQMKHPALNVAGQTSLGAVGFMISRAFALISNCTGVSHIASACKTPSIVISMDGEPERWGPLDKSLHTTIDWTKNQSYEAVAAQTASLFSRAPFVKAPSQE